MSFDEGSVAGEGSLEFWGDVEKRGPNWWVDVCCCCRAL